MNASLLEKLRKWYHEQGRSLPWREGQDPYRIWVIETLLQQTQIAQAEARIEQFFAVFPSLESLAQASVEDVLVLWRGLGYYQRAHNLHRAAQQLYAMGGFSAVQRVSDPLGTLLRLPGVGPYTARAILSFSGWGNFLPVDGNLLRVLSRLWAEKETSREFYQRKADELPIAWRQRWVAYALMDLARLVCTPRRPKCLLCPLAEGCAALRLGQPEDYPPRALRPPKSVKHFVFTLCRDGQGVWLEHRPPRGLWGGLWSLPMRSTTPVSDREPDFVHELTHFQLRGYIERVPKPPQRTQFIRWEELREYALPAPIQRLLMQEAEAHGVSFSPYQR
ncbi:MAG: NUDIX domain-containing protein [Bacteroidia bacterium]